MSGNSFFKTEGDLIAWIRRRTPRQPAGLALGIGDDAALVRVPAGREIILTADLSIEGVHFTLAHHPPQAVGHRALARSISDVAAMGGIPRFALISLAVSQHAGRAWLESFFKGLFRLARRFDVAIIGGDTAVVNGPTAVDVIVTGEIPRGRALLRSGAKAGDRIFTTGRLGMSALGLRLLMSRSRIRTPLERTALRAHLFPEPQCAAGQFLSEHRLATAMMDISDGISTDLRRLCKASGVGANLFANRIPAPPISGAEDALGLALHGGEDYQLLFTVAAAKIAKLPRRLGKVPLTCIGEICDRRGIRIVAADGKAQNLKPLGYDHFARA